MKLVKNVGKSSEIPELVKETASLIEMEMVGTGGGSGVLRGLIKVPCVTLIKSSSAPAVSSVFIADRADQGGWIAL